MEINELEKAMRVVAQEKGVNSIPSCTDIEICGNAALSLEFAEAAKTLAQRKNKKRAAVMSLLSPTTAAWM